MKRLYTTLLLFTISAGFVFSQTTWKADPAHTRVRFSATHMLIAEVSGEFKEFEGMLVTKNEDFSDAEVTFTAMVGSLNSDNERRDAWTNGTTAKWLPTALGGCVYYSLLLMYSVH